MTSRRTFLTTGAAASAATLWPWTSALAAPSEGPEVYPTIADFHRHIASPVEIARVELLRHPDRDARAGLFVRVTATDGTAFTHPANTRMQYLAGMFNGLVADFFPGKDARDVETLVEACFRDERNYKFCGMSLWNCIGHVEVAVLGLLGTIAQKPVADLVGPRLRDRVPVYLSTFDRVRPAAEYVRRSFDLAQQRGLRAVKIKIGGRMQDDLVPGRSEAVITGFRATFGDDAVLLADANGSFEDPARAISIGRLLEQHGYLHYEEPCNFREYDLTRRIADALTIPIAGGEQDSSLPMFRQMIAQRVVDIPQPDVYYVGGFLRLLKVAKMAEAAGMGVSPHSPHPGPSQAPFLHACALIPNLTGPQEYQANDRFAGIYQPPLEVVDGHLPIPFSAPAWGLPLDPALDAQLRPIEGLGV